MNVTRKFIWIRDQRWVVYCAGRELVLMTQYDEPKEIA